MREVKTCEAADVEENLRVANELKTALRTQPVIFVLRFISQNGLENLLQFLVEMNNIVRLAPPWVPGLRESVCVCVWMWMWLTLWLYSFIRCVVSDVE